MMIEQNTPVVVFTLHKSIYFGKLAEDYDGAEVLMLLDARHGYYLDVTEGVWQVTFTGPGKKAKIGPPVQTQIIRAVANVAIPTDAAVKAWNLSHWVK